MLDKSDTPISEVMKVFASYGQEAGYIVPTVTGMDKDILDAHGSLREFLKSKGIHDFDFQGQGGEHKKLVDIFLINEDSILETKMSLYRPETKSGDPRLWIYGLPKYAAPFNLLAFLFLGEKLYLINTSNPRLLGKSSALLGSPIKVISTRESSKQISIFEDSSNVEKTDNKITLKAEPLKELLQYQSNNLDRTESALIKKLEIISLQGFIDSLRSGDTGVGMTLETLLGIKANSKRAPDYFGIEIKAKRVTGRQNRSTTRATLFLQVPDWDVSACKNGMAILSRHGYVDSDTKRLQLYCTNSNTPNPQGLYLKVDEDNSLLESLKKKNDGIEKVASWRLGNLRAQLEAKHKKTFWVKAKTRTSELGTEQFHYYEVDKTESPLSSNLATLIEIGAVTMDYTLSQKATGNSARDHGYLFKIHPENFDLLFPPSKSIKLS
jgi:hypothetical protein